MIVLPFFFLVGWLLKHLPLILFHRCGNEISESFRSSVHPEPHLFSRSALWPPSGLMRSQLTTCTLCCWKEKKRRSTSIQIPIKLQGSPNLGQGPWQPRGICLFYCLLGGYLFRTIRKDEKIFKPHWSGQVYKHLLTQLLPVGEQVLARMWSNQNLANLLRQLWNGVAYIMNSKGFFEKKKRQLEL